ncbi:unnamed protein product [Linum tenue]|uniref:HECT-type E3 ubiquitin transferase n=1 Tax=Linum tenue TaxID=586396 RepID=A0AAV0GNB8_9ROSI|nr:unnamed protein product [Linum tenue]
MSQRRSSSVDCPSQRTAGGGAASPSSAAAADHRGSAKRKLDDYVSSIEEDDEDLVSVRMRKDDSPSAVNSSSDVQNHSLVSSSGGGAASAGDLSSLPSCSRTASPPAVGLAASVTRLQFFVRMISTGNHIVINASSEDTVGKILMRIQDITGIPAYEQRLIYNGKQLQAEQSLAECAIQKDAALHLVGRMRSTKHPQTCRLVEQLVMLICKLCRGGMPSSAHAPKHVTNLVAEFFKLTGNSEIEDAGGHFEIFMSYSAPAALVMLYISTNKGNKECADTSIKHFLNACRDLPKSLHANCAPVILEFCNLLRKVANDDLLYVCCRSTLGSFLENDLGWRWSFKCEVGLDDVKASITIADVFPFVKELAIRLCYGLDLNLQTPGSFLRPSATDVRDFSAFLSPFRAAISEHLGTEPPVSMPLSKREIRHLLYIEEVEQLHVIFKALLTKMDRCLLKLDASTLKSSGEGELSRTSGSQYLAILKELNEIAKLYQKAGEQFWTLMKLRKTSICGLIVKYAKRTDDHQWLLMHKEVTDFESRRHLAMMMLPEVKEDYEDLFEMLIDRAHLLEESFAYIGRAESESLHGGLFMEFKNEEATGPGVMREWFPLVVEAIFNPENALFLACPNDRRRFYPNPASKVQPRHLEFFNFSGRVIALALMHKVQVGIVLDRVLFLQLAGADIHLEDIRDADPILYSSCKQILDMDAEFIDSDALGLTFVREFEELGSRKVVQLCPNGKNIIVNSKNREEYIKLLIHHRFVTSISEQVSHFARGFSDILLKGSLPSFFFRSLELQDLDWVLYGSDAPICVEDWKEHTDYNGFEETDPQISWFWKIVGEMSAEQRRILLFFWTSVMYLPVEGFEGLTSRLYIYKSAEPNDRLPSSHTCFHRICFPPYPSMEIMQERLLIITQEHVYRSFGTW